MNAEASVFVRSDVLLEAITAVKHAAAKTPERPILCSVVLDIDAEGQARCVAADNYRIAIADVGLEVDGALRGSLPIRLADVSSLVAWLRSVKRELVQVTRDGGRLEFTAGARSLSVLLIDGTFPEWRRLMPAEVRPVVALNPRYLSELRIPLQRVDVHLDPERPGVSPVLLSGYGFREIIMPIRTEETGGAS